MTQDEYNALTDEGQNALVATEVLEFELDETLGAWISAGLVISTNLFNPKHDLNHTFMLVDKMQSEFMVEINGYDIGWSVRLGRGVGKTREVHGAVNESLNEAVMLSCLKAKGVVE